MRQITTGNVGVAIFAKAPIEGYAKSRLIARLGIRGATQLQRRFVEDAVKTAVAAKVGPVTLWGAPDASHPTFASMRASYGLDLYDQQGADLGERMRSACERLTLLRPLLIIGTDCPTLTPAHIAECAESLGSGADAVFLPTEDGGYALIGLRKVEPGLFEGIPWSTPAVMAETRLRAKQAGLAVLEPAMLWDVDTPDDYDRAVACGLIDERA